MIENPNVYVFFDNDKKPRFIAETNYFGACAIISASQGKLYCRELKDGQLYILGWPHPNMAKIADEQVRKEEIEGLIHYLKDSAVQQAMEIAMESASYVAVAYEGPFLKADPQPQYLHIPFDNGFMRIPMGETEDISIIKTMFDELLKIDGVKEIMEKYGVTFHENQT